MESLLNEIVELLGTKTYPVAVNRIVSAYSKKKIVYPTIVVEETDNSNAETVDGSERLSSLGYQIDIYSRDMLVDGTLETGLDVSTAIAKVVDDAIQAQYGFNRTALTGLYDADDPSIARKVIRYETILDVVTGYTYRKGV